MKDKYYNLHFERYVWLIGLTCFSLILWGNYYDLPKKVCYTENISFFYELNVSHPYFTFPESSQINCEEGVEINGMLVSIDPQIRCGLPISKSYNLEYYADSNHDFWDSYFNCKNNFRRTCFVTYKNEVCEVK